ncbi:MAG: nucleotidyltransferase substrate binding protein [Bacteroidota bacterium]|nr:nucleotidyltransferase substrate binding protein [Bacteroidota bacterium]
MTSEKDIRWKQRVSIFNKALKKLSEAVVAVKKDLDEKEIEIHNENTEEIFDEILKEGLIQRFKYTHELTWNVMRIFYLK